MESDEEMEFRRRDKFRSERSGGPRYQGDGHHHGPSRGYFRGYPPSRGHGPPRGPPPQYYHGEPEFRRGHHGSYGPPPMKRPRSEMDPMIGSSGSGHRRHERKIPPISPLTPIVPVSEPSNDGYQPSRLTFKAFLATQDDSITDEEAASKFNEYKLEFRRQQLNEFFSNHKESEWFREKYHPVDGKKKKDSVQNRVKKRLEIYQDLL